MKRVYGLLLALLFCASSALAEADGYWTRNADWYYHASEYCGGAEDMVPISLDGAEAFAKYPCPACVPEETEGEIQAVIEGGAGVVIVRIPDSRLGDDWFGTVRSYANDASYEGGAAYRALGDYLSGEDYIRFLSDYQTRSSAQAPARMPQIWGADSGQAPASLSQMWGNGGALVMSQRHLGGAWYFAVRPGATLRETFEMDSWPMYWRTNACQLRMENGVLICDYTTSTRTEQVELKLEVQSTEPIFEKPFGDLLIYVTQTMNEYVALILRHGEDAIPSAELLIGENSAIPLTCHINAGPDIYCCVLTEAELNALRSGAEVKLEPRPQWPTYYFGTPYAVLYDEEKGCAIVDREGKPAVEFGTYEGIEREGTDGTFRCILPDEGRIIYLDGSTLEQVGEAGD